MEIKREISLTEYESLNMYKEKYLGLIDKIQAHQGNEFNEETQSFIDNPDCDLGTIGELVLTELDMWR